MRITKFPEQCEPFNKDATTHLFEIPWNGDVNLITRIYESPYKDHVKFVYLPCLPEHGYNTRRGDGVDLSKELFEAVIELIRACDFEPCVLMQRRFDEKFLQYYYDLGIHYYTVGTDNIAHKIREHFGDDVYLTASITKDLMEDDFIMYADKYPDLYDIFILRHGFPRDIEGLQHLPKELKYGLIPNLPCLWNCPVYRAHWFPWETDIKIPPEFHCEDYRTETINTMFITYEDIWLFDPYVITYKLVGRTETTDIIFDNFVQYVTVSVNSENISDVQKDRAFVYYNVAHGVQKRLGDPIY